MLKFTNNMLFFKLKTVKCEKKIFYSSFGFSKLEIKFYEKTSIRIIFLVEKCNKICMLNVWEIIFGSIQYSVTIE